MTLYLSPQGLPTLQNALAAQAGLAFAVLVGSRATGRAHAHSDWDIAIQWSKTLTAADRLLATEELRQRLCHALDVPEERIDLIDLADARLAMRSLVDEEGVLLHSRDDLAWVRFLQNTWAELEDNDWRRKHAA